MLLFRSDRLAGVRVGKLKVIRVMLEHLLPELLRVDKTSAHILEMLVLSLKEKIDDVERTKH